MTSLVVYEDSLCERCRLEAKYGFDDSLTLLVDDFRCQGCRALAQVERNWDQYPPAAKDGLRLAVRPKLNGGQADGG